VAKINSRERGCLLLEKLLCLAGSETEAAFAVATAQLVIEAAHLAPQATSGGDWGSPRELLPLHFHQEVTPAAADQFLHLLAPQTRLLRTVVMVESQSDDQRARLL